MTTIQDIRTELAGMAPAGYEGYAVLPSNANLPAIVVDLPESVTFDGSLRFATLNFKIIVVVGTSFGPEVETKLLNDTIAFAKSLSGVNTNHIRSMMVNSVDSFYNVTIGSKEVLSSSINLSVLAEI